MVGGSYKVGAVKLYAGYSLIASSGEDTTLAPPIRLGQLEIRWNGSASITRSRRGFN
jgi:hypothetical protein